MNCRCVCSAARSRATRPLNARASCPSSSSESDRPRSSRPVSGMLGGAARHLGDRPQADRREPESAGGGQQQRDRDADEHRLAHLVLLARDVGERAARRRARTVSRAERLGCDVDAPRAARSSRRSRLRDPAGRRQQVGQAPSPFQRAASTAPPRVEDRDGACRGAQRVSELPRPRPAGSSCSLSSSRSDVGERAASAVELAIDTPHARAAAAATSTSAPNSASTTSSASVYHERQPRAQRQGLHGASAGSSW